MSRVIHRRRRTSDLVPSETFGAGGLHATALKLIAAESTRSIVKMKDVSGIRQRQREEILLKICSDLDGSPFKLRRIQQVGGRHVAYLFKLWHDQGQSVGTLQNKRTVLKWLADLSGKHGLVEPLEKYLPEGVQTKRSLVAKEDKSWSGSGVEFEQIASSIAANYPWAETLLRLIKEFGLRRSEAVCFRPRIALTIRDGVQVVWLRKRGWGTKGGRERFIPVLTQSQIEAIEQAKSYCENENDCVFRRNQPRVLVQSRPRVLLQTGHLF